MIFHRISSISLSKRQSNDLGGEHFKLVPFIVESLLCSTRVGRFNIIMLDVVIVNYASNYSVVFLFGGFNLHKELHGFQKFLKFIVPYSFMVQIISKARLEKLCGLDKFNFVI